MTTGLSAQAGEDTLRRYLEHVLPDVGPAGASIVHVCQAPAACATSYPSSLVTVQLNTGAKVKLFLKDFRFARLSWDMHRQRAERELRVYRDLLAGAGLGTARSYGAVSDEAEGRLGRVLALVDRRRVRSCELW